jgi:Undecaprenyl-phosphate glucose phosphotransferase
MLKLTREAEQPASQNFEWLDEYDRITVRPRRLETVTDRLFAATTRWRLMMFAQNVETIIMLIISLLAYSVYPHRGGVFQATYAICAASITISCGLSFYQGGLYQMQALLNPLRALRAIILRSTALFVTFAAAAAFSHEAEAFSREAYALFYAATISSLGLERILLARFIRAWIDRGHHTLSVAVVGANQLAEKFISKISKNDVGIRIVGVFDDRNREHLSHILGFPKLGSIDDLLEYSKAHEVDMVVVTLPLDASDRLQAVFRQLRKQPLNVRVLPGALGLERISSIRLEREEIPGVQLISVMNRPISEFSLLIKSLIEISIAGFSLLVLSPLFLACAIGIKFSSAGPVFFQQKRIGFKGREFNILKFRTMHLKDCGSERATIRNDPRTFMFGRLLRKSSIDELPQLINVLKGDMSLVGPRPHMVGQKIGHRTFSDAVAEYADRQRVKPGITGWAQVNGWRGPTENMEQIERRVEHDIYYIDNWSLLLDIVIIVRTCLGAFFGKNAF